MTKEIDGAKYISDRIDNDILDMIVKEASKPQGSARKEQVRERSARQFRLSSFIQKD